jgi:hypothetical protein
VAAHLHARDGGRGAAADGEDGPPDADVQAFALDHPGVGGSGKSKRCREGERTRRQSVSHKDLLRERSPLGWRHGARGAVTRITRAF